MEIGQGMRQKKVKEIFSNVSALPIWVGKFVGMCRHRARCWALHIVQILLVTHCPPPHFF